MCLHAILIFISCRICLQQVSYRNILFTMYIGGVNKQTDNNLEASKAMRNDKRAARNENALKTRSDGNSLKIPRIRSASGRRSDSETAGTRAHHAVQILSPRSQVLFVHKCCISKYMFMWVNVSGRSCSFVSRVLLLGKWGDFVEVISAHRV